MVKGISVVGHAVVKYFDDGLFNGEVISATEVLPGKYFYKIKYCDGDMEDVEEVELLKILLDQENPVPLPDVVSPSKKKRKQEKVRALPSPMRTPKNNKHGKSSVVASKRARRLRVSPISRDKAIIDLEIDAFIVNAQNAKYLEKKKRLPEIITDILRAEKCLGYVNVTGHSTNLQRCSLVTEGAAINPRFIPKNNSPLDFFLNVFPFGLLVMWLKTTNTQLSMKSSSHRTKSGRCHLRRLTFSEFLIAMACGILHAAATKGKNLRSVYKSYVQLGIPRIPFKRISYFRATTQFVDSAAIITQIEGNIQNSFLPGTICVVDESLPRARHTEPNPASRILMSIPRKPSSIGFLIYMLVCEFEWTGLPFPFAFIPVSEDNRISPVEAIIRLTRSRWLRGYKRHIHLIADSAFAARDARRLLVDNAVATDGITVDLTLSMSASYDVSLHRAMSYQLGINQFRLFYSPLTKSTMLIFKVHTHGKDHIITRWSNAFTDPRTSQVLSESSASHSQHNAESVTSVNRYSEAFARKLISCPIADLITLTSDIGKLYTSKDPYKLVQVITGIDLIQNDVQSNTSSDLTKSITIPGGQRVSKQYLQNQTNLFLTSMCKKYNLCAASSRMKKQDLIDRMVTACEMTSDRKNTVIKRFTASGSFANFIYTKEDHMPRLAKIYKKKFNKLDTFDSYLASIDTVIPFKSKNARLVEIYLLIAIVSSWTSWAESCVQWKYKTPLAYKIKCVESHRYQARIAFPLSEFIAKLRNSFADSKSWLPKKLAEYNIDEYGTSTQ